MPGDDASPAGWAVWESLLEWNILDKEPEWWDHSNEAVPSPSHELENEALQSVHAITSLLFACVSILILAQKEPNRSLKGWVKRAIAAT